MTAQFTPAKYLEASRALSLQLDLEAIQNAIDLIRTTAVAGYKIITCGNGGSAATASHYITDWNKMYNLAMGRKFRGWSLCDNIGTITAYGNDLAYDSIFTGQLKAILDPGDLLIAVSGSGNSPNILNAVEYANQNGGVTLGVAGYDGGSLLPMAQHRILVPSFDMQLCEDFHLIFGHMVMKALCGKPIA